MPRDGLEKEQHAYEVDHRRGDEGSEARFSADDHLFWRSDTLRIADYAIAQKHRKSLFANRARHGPQEQGDPP
jgi:hypothetical protein